MSEKEQAQEQLMDMLYIPHNACPKQISLKQEEVMQNLLSSIAGLLEGWSL